MSNQIILPNIPSKLLRIAIDDMKLTIKQGVIIDMDTWGKGQRTKLKKCTVCMAGSVMLQTTKLNINNLNDFDTDDVNENQYKFLDKIRQGSLLSAVRYLDIKGHIYKNKYEELSFAITIKNWQIWEECKPKVFFQQLEDLIIFLKSKNM